MTEAPAVDRTEVLRLLAQRTLPELEAELGRRDVCVAATRLGAEVCRYFGIDARPQPVMANAFNQQALDWIEGGRDWPKIGDPEEAEFWAAGCHIIGIDEEDRGERGRYPGHLVLWLPGREQILDLTIGQFSRPAKGLVLPDGALLPAPRLHAGEPVAHTFTPDDGQTSAIVYNVRSGDRFRRGADWRHNPRLLAGRLIREIREEAT